MSAHQHAIMPSPLPCIAGVAAITDKSGVYANPSQFFTELLKQAFKDADLDLQKSSPLVTDVATVRMQPENMGISYNNLAYQVANSAGVKTTPQCRFYSTSNGGDTPQKLINKFAKQIVEGKTQIAIVLGGELLDTFLKTAKRTQTFPEWGSEFEETNKAPPPCEAWGNFTEEVNQLERRNNLTMPKEMYAMMDQAARQEGKQSFQEAFEENGKLFDALNKYAAEQQPPGVSWFPARRTKQDILQVTKQNRWVAFPYPKYMNSVLQVNQGACIIMCSSELMHKLASKQKPVYLRGCGECAEPAFCVSQRAKMYTSVGMTESIDAAMKQAGLKSAKEIDEFDLYSCFPIALRVAKEHLKLEDYSKLTVTGGLPFYGGAGNAYTLCSVAMMTQKLRSKSENKEVFGLVNGNGWFMSKHSCGIYSNSAPSNGVWPKPESPQETQARADKLAGAPVELEMNPNGLGTIEAYIVEHGKTRRVVAFGRMQDTGKRFLASCTDQIDSFINHDAFGIQVEVSTPKENGPSQFVPNVQWDKLPMTGLQAKL